MPRRPGHRAGSCPGTASGRPHRPSARPRPAASHLGDGRGLHREHRVSLDPAPVLQPPEPPLQGCGPASPVGLQPEFLHQAGGLIDVSGGHGVLQRVLIHAVARIPCGGASLQHRDQLRTLAFQLRQEHVTEQVVVAVPLPPLVQRHQQQVGPGQIGQRRRGSGPVQHRLAQRPAHPLQHRGPGQEGPLPRGDPGQELRLHVLADEPVIPGDGDRRGPGRAAFPQAQRREIQPDRPSLGPPVQFRHLIGVQRHLRRAEQRGRLVAGQRQVSGADLGDPALGAQPRDPQRRLVPPGQRQPRAARHMIGQHRQRGPASGVVQRVHIIQDEHHRRRHRGERRPQPRDHHAGHRTGRGRQRVEHPPADRLHRIERFGHVGEQHLRVVICLVDRHPGERLPVALGPLRQQRGLPVAGRRDHRHDRTAVIARQPVDQRRPGDRPGPGRGTAQLRHDKVERGPARAPRLTGLLKHPGVVHAPAVPFGSSAIDP